MCQIFEYSLLHKEYTEWSRRLQKTGVHPLWLARDTPITHVGFSRQNPAHVLMHDAFMFCIIDQTLVRPPRASAVSHLASLHWTSGSI